VVHSYSSTPVRTNHSHHTLDGWVEGTPGTTAEPRRGKMGSGVRGRGQQQRRKARASAETAWKRTGVCGQRMRLASTTVLSGVTRIFQVAPHTAPSQAPHDRTGDESRPQKDQELGPSEARHARGLPRALCVVNHGRCGSGFTWHCGLSYQVTIAVFLGCSLCVREEGSTPPASAGVAVLPPYRFLLAVALRHPVFAGTHYAFFFDCCLPHSRPCCSTVISRRLCTRR